MRKLLAVLVVLLIAGAFAAGFWLQRERLIQAQADASGLRRQLAEAQSRLAEAEAKIRLGGLFAQFLALKDAVASGNFGEAQTSSSAFFDMVREQARATDDASARTALEAILVRRDAVTAALARGESSVREALAPIERELRSVFGYPVPPTAPVLPPAPVPPTAPGAAAAPEPKP